MYLFNKANNNNNNNINLVKKCNQNKHINTLVFIIEMKKKEVDFI